MLTNDCDDDYNISALHRTYEVINEDTPEKQASMAIVDNSLTNLVNQNQCTIEIKENNDDSDHYELEIVSRGKHVLEDGRRVARSSSRNKLIKHNHKR